MKSLPSLGANTEPVNLRIPKKLKEVLELVAEYQFAPSTSELVRTLIREHVLLVTDSPRYKQWMKLRSHKDREIEKK